MRVVVSRPFKQSVKKLPGNQKAEVDLAVRKIVSEPDIGDLKTGDLAGVRVYKFRLAGQQILLAYSQHGEDELFLLDIGPHENFYRDLKR